jgi:hypothetical protein
MNGDSTAPLANECQSFLDDVILRPDRSMDDPRGAFGPAADPGQCIADRQSGRLEAENLVLRHQLNVLRQRSPHRLHLRWADRVLFVWLYRRCPRILDVITIVKPETVVRWHQMGFAAYWRWKSRASGGRPRMLPIIMRMLPIIMKCVLTFR